MILDYNLPLTQLNRHSIVDVCIDGSDECDSKLNCIKGGGGCQLQEKLVASNSKLFVIIADYRKNSDLLGTQWNKGLFAILVYIIYYNSCMYYKDVLTISNTTYCLHIVCILFNNITI